jgi:hypothetical protein
MKKPSKLVAVVVPLSTRPGLTDSELISLRHLRHFLGRYDNYMIHPESLRVSHEGFKMLPFGDPYFGSVANHSKLLVSPRFYKTFKDYRYIFIYHLDSLVFSDQLTEWCQKDYDFIAPPWIEYAGAPYQGLGIENLCGNGGFSLRKVRSFRRVLRILRRPHPTLDYLRRILRRRKRIEDKKGEDVFWGTVAPMIDPSFRVAPFDDALQFAFECNPRLCFEKNRHRMPFGCHAWERYDRAFWEPRLIAEELVT